MLPTACKWENKYDLDIYIYINMCVLKNSPEFQCWVAGKKIRTSECNLWSSSSSSFFFFLPSKYSCGNSYIWKGLFCRVNVIRCMFFIPDILTVPGVKCYVIYTVWFLNKTKTCKSLQKEGQRFKCHVIYTVWFLNKTKTCKSLQKEGQKFKVAAHWHWN